MQPHLLSQGEVDPYEFVGRDDRPRSMQSYNPKSVDSDYFSEVAHSVRETGVAVITALVQEGRLISRDSVSNNELISTISKMQIPVWIALSDAMDVLHRAFGHIAPQRLTSILRDRKLEKP